MSDLEQRIAHLENLIEKMQLETRASRVAISMISATLSKVIGEETNLGEMYLTGIASAEQNEFDHPVSDDYQNKLNEKVAALLGKS